jgi:hypothetical protein
VENPFEKYLVNLAKNEEVSLLVVLFQELILEFVQFVEHFFFVHQFFDVLYLFHDQDELSKIEKTLLIKKKII